jgi:hypothetical protein
MKTKKNLGGRPKALDKRVSVSFMVHKSVITEAMNKWGRERIQRVCEQALVGIANEEKNFS